MFHQEFIIGFHERIVGSGRDWWMWSSQQYNFPLYIIQNGVQRSEHQIIYFICSQYLCKCNFDISGEHLYSMFCVMVAWFHVLILGLSCSVGSLCSHVCEIQYYHNIQLNKMNNIWGWLAARLHFEIESIIIEQCCKVWCLTPITMSLSKLSLCDFCRW